jgi:hypothetical protein
MMSAFLTEGGPREVKLRGRRVLGGFLATLDNPDEMNCARRAMIERSVLGGVSVCGVHICTGYDDGPGLLPLLNLGSASAAHFRHTASVGSHLSF